MNQTDYRARLENFPVLKGRIDQALFKYGPFIFSVQICLSVLIFLLEHDNPFGFRNTLRWYELDFFLFALLVLIVEIYVTRDLFQNIPRTFIELTRRNILKGLRNNKNVSGNFGQFLREFEEKLNYPMPLALGGVFETIILVVLQRSSLFPIIFLPKHFPAAALILNFLTIFLPLTIAGYMIGIVVWKCSVTGYYVHKFSGRFEIAIQPSHPDKAGGLKPLGDLIFSMALILIVASLALSILTIASQINQSLYGFLSSMYSPRLQVQAPFYLYSTEWLARVSLAVAILLSIGTFLLPIMNTHRRMRTEKANLILPLAEVGNRIAQLEKLTQKINIGYKERNEAFAEIASLSKMYEVIHKSPVWPFDRDILIKFFTPQTISLLSLVGGIQPILDSLASWVK